MELICPGAVDPVTIGPIGGSEGNEVVFFSADVVSGLNPSRRDLAQKIGEIYSGGILLGIVPCVSEDKALFRRDVIFAINGKEIDEDKKRELTKRDLSKTKKIVPVFNPFDLGRRYSAYEKRGVADSEDKLFEMFSVEQWQEFQRGRSCKEPLTDNDWHGKPPLSRNKTLSGYDLGVPTPKSFGLETMHISAAAEPAFPLQAVNKVLLPDPFSLPQFTIFRALAVSGDTLFNDG